MLQQRFIAALTATCFLFLSTNGAMAGVIATDDFMATADRSAQITRIESALANERVQGQLIALGVDPAEAARRVASLSDRELATVADRLDSLPAGGDSILAVIGIVFVVLFILELTGVTDIFKRF